MSNDTVTLERLKDVKSAADLLQLIYGQHNLSNLTLPINVEDIVSRIQKVEYSDDLSFEDWDKSGYIKVVRDSNKDVLSVKVWVNPSENNARQRFTASHEIGHLIHDIVPNLDDDTESEAFVDKLHRDGKTTFKETRANKFAAQLLMPKELVKREVERLVSEVKERGRKVALNVALEKLSAQFHVSEQSMEIRLKTLGYIR